MTQNSKLDSEAACISCKTCLHFLYECIPAWSLLLFLYECIPEESLLPSRSRILCFGLCVNNYNQRNMMATPVVLDSINRETIKNNWHVKYHSHQNSDWESHGQIMLRFFNHVHLTSHLLFRSWKRHPWTTPAICRVVPFPRFQMFKSFEVLGSHKDILGTQYFWKTQGEWMDPGLSLEKTENYGGPKWVLNICCPFQQFSRIVKIMKIEVSRCLGKLIRVCLYQNRSGLYSGDPWQSQQKTIND